MSDDLELKVSMEFNHDLSIPMPKLATYNISVMYALPPIQYLTNQSFFLTSLKTVIERFPDAMEVVLVAVDASDEDTFRGVIAPMAKSAPFPIRIVSTSTDGDGSNAQLGPHSEIYRRLRADLYCTGDFILHMDPMEVILKNVTYDSLFHLGKPVMPYGRYSESQGERISFLSHSYSPMSRIDVFTFRILYSP